MYLLVVENESHCDFTKLREMLIRTNMEDLRDTTHTKHYEVYRKDRLQQVTIMYEILNKLHQTKILYFPIQRFYRSGNTFCFLDGIFRQ